MNNKIAKIVLTGGPCAGKTTALLRTVEKFTDRGYMVLTPLSPLEIEDAGRHEDMNFPPFIRVVEDVTDNQEFYNSNLAWRK